MIKKCSSGSTGVFQGFDRKVLTLQICLYWAAVLIPTFIALKHLLLLLSTWPIGPLVDKDKQSDKKNLLTENANDPKRFWKAIKVNLQ